MARRSATRRSLPSAALAWSVRLSSSWSHICSARNRRSSEERTAGSPGRASSAAPSAAMASRGLWSARVPLGRADVERVPEIGLVGLGDLDAAAVELDEALRVLARLEQLDQRVDGLGAVRLELERPLVGGDRALGVVEHVELRLRDA